MTGVQTCALPIYEAQARPRLRRAHQPRRRLVGGEVDPVRALGLLLRRERAGGDASLAAVLVIITGVIGSIIVTPLMNSVGVRDMRARGFAVGVAAHGIGTARAFQVDMMAGTFAGIGMGLNAMLTPILVPILLPWLLG